MLIDSAQNTGSIIISASILPEATGDQNGIHDIGSLAKPFRDLFITTSSLNFVRDGAVVSVINGGDDYIQVGNIIIGTSSISYASGSDATLQNIITIDTASADNMVTFESPDGENSSYTGSFSGSFHGDGARITNIASATTASYFGAGYISSSVLNNTITFNQGDDTTDTIIVHTGSGASSFGDLTGVPAGLVSSSAQILPIATSSVTNFDTEVSRSVASAGFGIAASGLSATDTANVSSSYYSSSIAQNRLSLTNIGGTTTTLTIDTGSGGGGDTTDLNNFTGSANTRLNSLSNATGSYVTEAESGSFLTTASVSSDTITFTKGDGTTFPIQVAGSGGGGGGDATTPSIDYNNVYRYFVTITPTARLQLQSSGDYFNNVNWNRSGTTINITASNHGMATGCVVALRNASEDHVIASMTNIDANHFSMDVANSGATTGTAAGFTPLFSGSLTESSGDVSAVSVTSPFAQSGSAALHSVQLYASNQETSPIAITVPAGEKESAGLFGSKLGINLPMLVGYNFDGTNVGGSLTSLAYLPNLGTNQNVFNITGADNFSEIQVKLSFI